MGASFLSWKELPHGPMWLISPHLSSWQTKALVRAQELAPDDSDTIWVLSSGTQSVNQIKCIGLKRQAFLCSAEAVNRHLESSHKDHWLLAIPDYHVGGFSIYARAHLSGARVSHLHKWTLNGFLHALKEAGITLTSLVPTQIHDLVMAQVQSPKNLRAVVVGGGSLSNDLYQRARLLGWPVLPSYGLTESASQVATASLSSLKQKDSPALTILPHAEIELRESRICIRSDWLSQWTVTVNMDGLFTMEDPRRSGWLLTEDIGEWREDQLQVLGRRDQVVKILGVLVPVPQIENDLQELFRAKGVEGRIAVLPLPSSRDGHELVMMTDSTLELAKVDKLVVEYNRRALRPHRLSRWGWTEKLHQSELQKIKRGELLARLRI